MQRSQVKVMLITFFNHQEMVHHEFVPQGQTVNQHFYKKDLTRLVNKFVKNLDLGQEKLGSCIMTMLLPTYPSAETVLGLERNHHVASYTLFAGLSPLRFLSFSKAERDSQGDLRLVCVRQC